MVFKLNYDICLKELKKSPFLISVWKDEIIKSAKVMERIGKSYEKINEYLDKQHRLLEQLKEHGYADLLEKPLAEIELLFKKYEKLIKKGETHYNKKRMQL